MTDSTRSRNKEVDLVEDISLAFGNGWKALNCIDSNSIGYTYETYVLRIQAAAFEVVWELRSTN